MCIKSSIFSEKLKITVEITFEGYLKEQKIDSDLFKKKQSEKWLQLKLLFDQVHPNSFTLQKKFLINDLRRAYPYSD